MKKQFAVLKNKPEIIIRLTRDSVCAADDFDTPHEKNLKINSFLDPTILVSNIYTNYLPSVNGYGHSWDCILNEQIIAVISVKGIEAKVFEITYQENNVMHFKYNSSTY